MREEWREDQTRKAHHFFQQVRLYAKKYKKKEGMAFYETRERFPGLFIPPEWSDVPLQRIEPDHQIEAMLKDKAKAYAIKQGGKQR